MLVAGSASGAAQTPPPPLQPLRLQVVELPECEDPGRFERAFREQSPGVQVVVDGDSSARELRVRIERRAEAIVGQLEMLEHGERDQREISGQSCAEVVEALALIASVLVSTAQPADAPALAPAAHAVAARTQLVHPAPRGLGVHVALGGSLAVAMGTLPRIALHPRGFVAAELGVPNELPLSALRVSVAYATADTEVEAVEVHFAAVTARGECCGPRIGARVLSGEACASMELGWLRGVVDDAVSSMEERAATWLAAGVLARALYRADARLRVEVEGGASFPLARPAFFVDQTDGSRVELFRAPSVAGFAALSVALTFP